jgi:hypothetical protein
MAAKQAGLLIPADQLPAPGEEVEIEIDGYQLMVINANPVPNGEPQVGDVVDYWVATCMRNGRMTSTIHAVAMIQRTIRKRRAEVPLCSPKGETQTKVVSAHRPVSIPLKSVTCGSCRKRLVEAGALPVDSAPETTEREDSPDEH